MSLAHSAQRLERSFYARPTLDVACELLGAVVVTRDEVGVTAGRIVEVEGYLDASDPASHSARLKTGRVAAMAGSAGVAYVYRSMGIHAMLNIVTEATGTAGAVLIRALEPVEGIDVMRARRGVADERLLCSGPGRLCQALGITLDDHGEDVVEGDRIWIVAGTPPASISASGRIGISRATDKPWRFFETDNRYVSVHRRGDVLI